jgi:RNA polymerase sigma-70 factor (ECF subfamily)
MTGLVSLPDWRPEETMDRLTRCFLEIRDELVRFLTRRNGRSGAEDVVQDAWLKLQERGDAESWREPRAILYTTAAHLGTDTQRRDAHSDRLFARESEFPEAECPRPGPESQAETESQLNTLAAALEELSPECREAFLLNRLDGLTHAEIAQRLGVSTKTVQRHIERALRLCVQVLE